MTARDKILSAIRRQRWEGPSRPELNDGWTQYDDPIAQFASVLQAVGGDACHVPNAEAAHAALTQLEAYQSARQRSSLVPGVGDSAIDPLQMDDPHRLQDLDYAVLPGQFAVAENAAVWVTHGDVRHRAVYYLTQHLVLVVPANQIVHNMHEAYVRLSFEEPGFGCFVSGPSKTADIEQSLVIGCAWLRSLTVFLIDHPAGQVLIVRGCQYDQRRELTRGRNGASRRKRVRRES